MAQAQQELKLYPAAAESYRRLVQYHPKSRFVAAGLRGLAQSLTLAGHKAEAKQVWQDMLQRASKDASMADVSVELGLLLQSEGEHRKAIEQFGRAMPRGTQRSLHAPNMKLAGRTPCSRTTSRARSSS